jgi:hypothetical protein
MDIRFGEPVRENEVYCLLLIGAAFGSLTLSLLVGAWLYGSRLK